MNDHESEFGRKVAGYLDRGAADLRSGTLYRLQQARAAALAGVAVSRIGELALATGSGSSSRSAPWASPVRWLGIALLVAAMGFGFQQWRAVQQVHEFEELDLHLLASDLPIDAYLDRGFQNWLRTTFEH
jgi:hypothetical protein